MGEYSGRTKNADRATRRENDPRLKQHHAALQERDLTDKEMRMAALTVCDPAEGYDRMQLTKEEAREVLTALGLVDDPEHTEMNWMGRKAGT